MNILTWIKQKYKKVVKNMDKVFRDDNGNELTASNEIQAAAYENQGFKASKSASRKADTEFSSELGANANMGSSLTPSVDAKDMQTVQATGQSANTFATEFSQELGAQQDPADEQQAMADAKAAQKANRTKK
jgi:hypothetical protein